MSLLPDEMTDEDFCRFQLANLQQSYMEATRPWIERLVLIESMKPTPKFIWHPNGLCPLPKDQS